MHKSPQTARAMLAAIDQMDTGVIVADADGAIVFVNAAAARIHGVADLGVPVERYGPTYHLYTEAGQPYPSEQLPLARAVMRGESVIDERWRIRRPDGTEILATGSARAVTDDDGVRIGAVLTLRDDSDRQTAALLEQERNALARQMQEAFAQSPQSTVIYDATGKPLAVNQAFERLWGVAMADVPPTYSVLTDPQLEAAGVMPMLRRAFGLDGARTVDGEGESVLLPPVRYEMDAATARSMTLWTQAHVYPVRDAAGAIVRVVLTHDDVTSRRNADVARERNAGLQALTVALSQAATITDVCDAIMTHAPTILGAVGMIVARRSADGTLLELMCASHLTDDVRDAWARFPADAEAPLARVAASGEPVFLESRDDIARQFPHLLGTYETVGHHANVVLPLTHRGNVDAVLGAAFDAPQQFDEDFRAIADTLGRLCAQALERARLFEAERDARHAAEQANRAKGV